MTLFDASFDASFGSFSDLALEPEDPIVSPNARKFSAQLILLSLGILL